MRGSITIYIINLHRSRKKIKLAGTLRNNTVHQYLLQPYGNDGLRAKLVSLSLSLSVGLYNTPVHTPTHRRCKIVFYPNNSSLSRRVSIHPQWSNKENCWWETQTNRLPVLSCPTIKKDNFFSNNNKNLDEAVFKQLLFLQRSERCWSHEKWVGILLTLWAFNYFFVCNINRVLRLAFQKTTMGVTPCNSHWVGTMFKYMLTFYNIFLYVSTLYIY